jgi:hypothetical protein
MVDLCGSSATRAQHISAFDTGKSATVELYTDTVMNSAINTVPYRLLYSTRIILV